MKPLHRLLIWGAGAILGAAVTLWLIWCDVRPQSRIVSEYPSIEAQAQAAQAAEYAARGAK